MALTVKKIIATVVVYAFIVYIFVMGVVKTIHVRSHNNSNGLPVKGGGNGATTTPQPLLPIQRNETPPCAAMPRPAIVVLTFNRPQFLKRTLDSLLRLKYIEHYDVFISQDGGHGPTMQAAQGFVNYHPTLVQYWQKERPKIKVTDPKVPNWGWVAQHYKWALDRLFAEEEHSHVIIVEDDMEFSYDFLNYFQKTAWLLDADPTLMCISSWNDNSRAHLGTDPSLLLRTSYFPGLGWMLKREFYINELQEGWPTHSHWDNWLRANILNKDCISPSLPRNRNFGSIGTSMNTVAFNKEIASMKFYQGRDEVNFGDTSYLLAQNYDPLMRDLLSKAMQLDFPVFKQVGAPVGTVYLMLYGDSVTFQGIAKHFQIWAHPRSHYKYLQLLEHGNDIFLIADVRFCPLLPEYLQVRPSPDFSTVVAEQGEDCVMACARKNQMCSPADMPWLNDCNVLKKHFSCEKGCILETGLDIPSYVSGELPTHGFCVTKMHNELIVCQGLHVGTSRLCACSEK